MRKQASTYQQRWHSFAKGIDGSVEIVRSLIDINVFVAKVEPHYVNIFSAVIEIDVTGELLHAVHDFLIGCPQSHR